MEGEAGSIILAKYSNYLEAEYARLALEGAGIPCTILDGNQGAYVGMGMLFPVRLMVLADDEEAARKVLSDCVLPEDEDPPAE